MFRTLSLRLAVAAMIVAAVLAPSALNAQKALVYCPVGIDAGGCTTIVAALNADATRFPGGADAGYDGTQGTLDLATTDFSSYAVFVVPSLADGPDAQPYALLRNGTIAGRLQAAFMGRAAVWSGTPDVGTTNRSSKDALIRNLAAWATSDAAGTHGPGVVALQDNSDDESARYGWLSAISAMTVGADTTFDVYSNVQVLTSTGQAILTSGGLQLGYTNMASYGLVTSGASHDATGARTSRVVLATVAGDASDPNLASVNTDKDDYQPGDTVTVTGAGWEPGETVSLLFHEDIDPPVHPDKSFTAVADGDGRIVNRDYLIDDEDLNVRFTLQATGLSSGKTAQATFTDAVSFQGITAAAQTPDPIAPGASATYAVTVQFNGNNTPTCSVTLSASGLPAGAAGSFSPNPVLSPGGSDQNTTLTITTNAGTTPVGTTTVTITGVGTGCGGTKTTTVALNVRRLTNTAVTSSLNPSLTGQSVTFTATVTQVAGGAAVTTGSVAFIEGGTCAAPTTVRQAATAVDGTGQVTFTTSTLNAGSHTIVGCYGGTTTFGASSGSVNQTVNTAVDLTLSKSHSGSFDVGNPESYALVVANAGSANTAGTVTVTDNLPTGLTFVSGAGTGWTCSAAAQVVTCNRTTAINAGANTTITLNVNVGAAAFPSVTNTASVSGGNEPAANNGNNSDSDPTTVNGADLAVDKSHTGSFNVGVTGAYSISVTNSGTAATSAPLSVTDALPTGLDFVSANGGGTWSCGFNSGTNTVTCTRASNLGAGNSAPVITVTVLPNAAAFPTVTNVATVSGGNEPAASTGNNSDSDPTAVGAGVDLTIDKSHTGNFTEGVNGTYSFTVSNPGGTATSASVTVTDALPTGLGFVSGGGTNGWNACTFSAPTVTCVRPAANTIAAGGSAPALTITVSVAAAAVPSVTNTASVAGGGEPAANNGNNSDSDPTTVIAGNQAPIVVAGGPYTGNEGTAIALSGASATDPDAGDTPIIKWTYVANGAVDAGTSCSFSNDAVIQPTFTCNDDGAFTLTLKVDDQHGHVVQENADVTVTNVKPTATAGGPYTGNEGSAIQLGGSGDDPAANDDDPKLSYKWTVNTTGIDTGGSCVFDDDTRKDAKITCTDDGAFKVSLVVTDDDGAASDASIADLTVGNVNPVAHAGGPYSGNEGSDISLTGSATDAGSNDGFTYKWTADVTGIDAGGACTFGNDTHASTTVKCTDDGAFKVKLTVTDDDGGSHSEEVALDVANVDPVASAGGDYTGDEGSPVQLAGSATDVGSNDTFSWSWEAVNGPAVDAGATCSFSDIHAQNPTVTCTDDGEFKLTLTVKDDNNGQDTDDALLTLQNVKPVASAGGPYSGDEGAAITLNGSANDPGDNDDPYLTYKWTVNTTGIDAGGSCSFDDDTQKAAKVTCTDDSKGGTFTLSLVATDDDGASSVASTASLTVLNVDPVADAGGAYNGDEGSPVLLHGSATDVGANDTFTWSWEAVNGPAVDAGATCSFSDIHVQNPTVTCTDDGEFKLTLTVKDDNNGQDSDDATLTLANVKPVASAGGPYSGNEGAAITLTGSANDPGDNDDPYLTYKWTVNTTGMDADGQCTFDDDTKKNAQVTCTDDSNGGTFTLSLVATDDDGASSLASTTTVAVSNLQPVAMAGSSYSGNEGSAIGLSGSANDPGDNDDPYLTYKWTVTPSGIDAGGACTFDDDTKKNAQVTCTDDSNGSTFTLTLVATDDDGASSTGSTATLTVINVKPSVATITKSDGTPLPTTIIVAGTLNLKVPFGDPGSNDTQKAQIDCGEGAGYVNVNSGNNVTTNFLTACTFATVGVKTVKVKVADDDGFYDEKSFGLTIKYNFDGFYAPVDRPNTMNVSKAGQAIPLKWRLTDANGAPITDLAAVTIQAKDQSCSLGVTTDQLEEYAAGSSGLQNLGNGNYQFNWKTPSTYTGSCKSIMLVFGAGAVSYVDGPYAFFSFKK